MDVGARAQIYRQLRKPASKGVAIVFGSSDTQEVIGLADRVVTFYHGRMIRSMSAHEAIPEAITKDVTHPDLSVSALGA